MSFADDREQLLAETGTWATGGKCKIKKTRPYVGNPAIDRTNSLGRLVRYAPFIVVLFLAGRFYLYFKLGPSYAM
jgi:hypothetical protein